MFQSTRGRGTFRGRGSGGGAQNTRRRLPTDVACDVQGCGAFARDANGLALHKAAKHGASLQTKDGTPSNYTATVNSQLASPWGQGRRSRGRGRGGLQMGPTSQGRIDGGFFQPQQQASGIAGPSQVRADPAYLHAPQLWVASAGQTAIRQDRQSLRARATLIAGRDVHLIPRKPFTIGNGNGNTVNTTSVATWSGDLLNSTTATTVPYPMFEFIGLDVSVHGDFGSHGDFALVYLTSPNGSGGLTSSNTVPTTGPSSRAKELLALRWSQSLTRHTIITGSGNFFIPADGPGSRIQGAAHVNVVSGTSVLNPNAVLVTVCLFAVFAVTGDRT